MEPDKDHVAELRAVATEMELQYPGFSFNQAKAAHLREAASMIETLLTEKEEAAELLRMWYDRWTGVQVKIATPSGLVQRTKRVLGIS